MIEKKDLIDALNKLMVDPKDNQELLQVMLFFDITFIDEDDNKGWWLIE